ncbi:MAG: DUF4830 domain-containing protein [Clostridia bacterium]|nr:DUF4830 domain-containing protein [Clostridia bacterium]
MFILTVKSKKIKRITAVLISILAIFFLLFIFKATGESRGHQEENSSLIDKNLTHVKSNEDRVKFLSAFGWEVNPEPLEIVDVTIPEVFNDTYENYNTIQKNQGLDLSKYKGKKCTRFTYQILNHKDSPRGTRANILVIKNTIIGGDICSVELDGFMHGFANPEGTEKKSNGETYHIRDVVLKKF